MKMGLNEWFVWNQLKLFSNFFLLSFSSMLCTLYYTMQRLFIIPNPKIHDTHLLKKIHWQSFQLKKWNEYIIYLLRISLHVNRLSFIVKDGTVRVHTTLISCFIKKKQITKWFLFSNANALKTQKKKIKKELINCKMMEYNEPAEVNKVIWKTKTC